MMTELYNYIKDEFPGTTNTHFANDMLQNILEESEKIDSIAERCDWLAKMIPQITVNEIRNILLR